tara:strand:- start:3617 stop:4075 length:459 start_codon:yes stop_codon:yes gene_type:complete
MAAQLHFVIANIEYSRWSNHIQEWRNKIANDTEYQQEKKIKEAIESANNFHYNNVETVPRYECYVEGEGTISEISLDFIQDNYCLSEWVRAMYELVENEKFCKSARIEIFFVDHRCDTEVVHVIQDYKDIDNCCCENCESQEQGTRVIVTHM